MASSVELVRLGRQGAGNGEPVVELAEPTAGDDRHDGVIGAGAGLVDVHPVVEEPADQPPGLRHAEQQRPRHALVLPQPRRDVPKSEQPTAADHRTGRLVGAAVGAAGREPAGPDQGVAPLAERPRAGGELDIVLVEHGRARNRAPQPGGRAARAAGASSATTPGTCSSPVPRCPAPPAGPSAPAVPAARARRCRTASRRTPASTPGRGGGRHRPAAGAAGGRRRVVQLQERRRRRTAPVRHVDQGPAVAGGRVGRLHDDHVVVEVDQARPRRARRGRDPRSRRWRRPRDPPRAPVAAGAASPAPAAPNDLPSAYGTDSCSRTPTTAMAGRYRRPPIGDRRSGQADEGDPPCSSV